MDGFVPLLKPPGMTSSNAVYDVRRIFSQERAGHLGTLDPGAAGVLPICLGRATRLFDLLVDKEKEYVFEIVFGAATDTQDAYGRVTARDGHTRISAEALIRALPGFTGEQAQTAPVYSALKVDGRKMYDLAREGKAVSPRIRTVTIHELACLEQTGENRFLLKMRCSRGTYVRTVCADLGIRLGTYAHMGMLIRTASGPFALSSAVTVAELETLKAENRLLSALISCEEALSGFPALTLPLDRLRPAKNGLPTHVPGVAEGPVRLYCEKQFLGVGLAGNDSVKLTVHLYENAPGDGLT